MRRQARETALQINYQRSQIKKVPFSESWHVAKANLSANELDFCQQLTNGAEQHKSEIDSWVQQTLLNWSTGRLQNTLQAIFQLGITELLLFQKTDHQVVINEWLEICRDYAGEPAVKLCNGVLDQVRKQQIDNH